MLPIALAVSVALVLIGWRRGVYAWLAGVLGTLGMMLLLKLLFGACGALIPAAHIHSPSGHTAAAAVMYGGICALLGASFGLTLAIASGAACVFAASRVMLGFHSLPETLVGGLVGLCGAALIAYLAGPPPPVRRRKTRVLSALLVAAVLFHGAHVHAETSIKRFARLLEVWPLSMCRMTPPG